MSKKIRVLMCPVDRAPYITWISDALENLQKIVGGNIEVVPFTLDAIAICNEEGRIMGLPENPSVSWLFRSGLCGDCFFCGIDEEEFADLPDEHGMLLKACKRQYELTGGSGK